MKSIELILLEEEELPFWSNQTVEIIVKNYGEFKPADKAILRELTAWIKGENTENPIHYKIKEADQA